MTPTGQTADGSWEIGVRRSIPLPTAAAWEALRTALLADPGIGAIRAETPGDVLRVDYAQPDWPDFTTVQIRVLAAAHGATLAVHHEHLPGKHARQGMHTHWSELIRRVGPAV